MINAWVLGHHCDVHLMHYHVNNYELELELLHCL
jgi:hypothetical protein